MGWCLPPSCPRQKVRLGEGFLSECCWFCEFARKQRETHLVEGRGPLGFSTDQLTNLGLALKFYL